MNKVNSDKSDPLMSGNMNATANIDNNIIESGDVHRLFQITIDSKLMFENRKGNVSVMLTYTMIIKPTEKIFQQKWSTQSK